MPRTARVDVPGATHHVTVRGVERRTILLDDDDRSTFVTRLEANLLKAGTACFAWALMPNHVHLLLRTGGEPLPRVMARLWTGYAMDFNGRHLRVGHLFQNRYHSRLVEREGHLLEAVRAGIVPDLPALERYPWTGYRGLMGEEDARFLAVDAVLEMVHEDRRVARQRLQEWMEAGIAARSGAGEEEEYEAPGGMELEPRGQGPTAEPIDQGDSTGIDDECRAAIANALRLEGWDLDALLGHVCGRLGVAAADLRMGLKARRVSRARAAIAWLGRERLGLSLTAMAPALGVSEAALSKGFSRGRAAVEQEELDPRERGDRAPSEPGRTPGSQEVRNVPTSASAPAAHPCRRREPRP